MSQNMMHQIFVEEIHELKLVGFRVVCTGEQYIKEIPKASKLLYTRLNEVKHVVNPSLQIGVFNAIDSSEEKDGYWICVEVKSYVDVPEDMVTLTVPPQKYAVIRHRGSNFKIMDAYSQLHRWIKDEGFTRMTDSWHLEKFHSWQDSKKIDVELYDTII
ncbi:GyrI-like domain-containing protein [Chengkuizengella axinellae]|uniref:GyrI-like domain-containing protein n=1 Tax=Chengkuizengella axinellae TaxID=3064388 RepID=A0ABT9J1D2_9BACL|nr:GyrI-like domain-containing protein [Chengkuizengella sp. 2205SS18-9]MDP5275431.1 GyrI-like domain-containing protein [Chengkuizengella sp. 2205SS18-9]